MCIGVVIDRFWMRNSRLKATVKRIDTGSLPSFYEEKVQARLNPFHVPPP